MQCLIYKLLLVPSLILLCITKSYKRSVLRRLYKNIYKKVGVLLIRMVKSNVSNVGLSSVDEGSTPSLTKDLARNARRL